MAINVMHLAWKAGGVIPEPVIRCLATAGGLVTWLRRGTGVRRLERNLRRVCPDLDDKAIRRLSRTAMRSYMRYYSEVLTLRTLKPEQILARVRCVGRDHIDPLIGEHQSVPLALSHQGNWDMAGAFSSIDLAPVITVAERLEPPELFEEFLKFRTDLGMTIHALGDDGVFGRLLRATRKGPGIIPLLADRDLSAQGVEVDFFGERARVAPGPAALSVHSKVPIVPLSIYYERLTGERRKRAGSPWGIVLHFWPPESPDVEMPRREQIAELTQRWVNSLEEGIRQHPEDWHMLQKVFIDDLDPDRYQQITGESVSDG